jgi:hypothetical protein
MSLMADPFQLASPQSLLTGNRIRFPPRGPGLETFDRLDRIAAAGLRGTFLCPRN